MNASKPEYLSMTAVKARRWTDRAVAQFLGPHDKEAPNWRFKSGPPTKLYLLSRVEEAEQSDAYRAFVAANAARVAGARRTVANRDAEVVAKVEARPVSLTVLPLGVIRRRAIRYYNDEHWYPEIEDSSLNMPASEDSPPVFLDRIMVEYLEHTLSGHYVWLTRLIGHGGKSEGYLVLSRKISEAIATAYPELREECEKKIRKNQAVGQD